MINQAVEIHRARGDLLRLGGALRLLAIQLGKNGSQAKARAAVSEARDRTGVAPAGPELARTYNTRPAATNARW